MIMKMMKIITPMSMMKMKMIQLILNQFQDKSERMGLISSWTSYQVKSVIAKLLSKLNYLLMMKMILKLNKNQNTITNLEFSLFLLILINIAMEIMLIGKIIQAKMKQMSHFQMIMILMAFHKQMKAKMMKEKKKKKTPKLM